MQSFVHWIDQRDAVPLIQSLQAQADEWRSRRTGACARMLARGEDVDAVLEALSRGLTQKMLHGALAELHAASGDERAGCGKPLPASSCAKSVSDAPPPSCGALAPNAAAGCDRIAAHALPARTPMKDILRQQLERLPVRLQGTRLPPRRSLTSRPTWTASAR